MSDRDEGRAGGRPGLLAAERGACIMLALLAVGCAPEPPPGAAPGEAVLTRDEGAPIQTDALAYELRRTGIGLEARIPFSFSNPLPDTVYVVNCRGQIGMSLEKEVDGEWERFWSPVMLMCLSPPIVIEPHGVLEDTLSIHGVLPGNDAEPSFRTADVAGTYRLLWDQLVRDYDDDRPGFGDTLPLELRRSNRFQLQEGG